MKKNFTAPATVKPLEITDVATLIDRALEEDIGSGDATTLACIDMQTQGRARLVARENMVLCGVEVAREVFELLDETAETELLHYDGDRVSNGDVIMTVEGYSSQLLQAERTALNFLQRMSGIATLAARFAWAVNGTGARVVDTRKTTPGWRQLEKYAVRVGGAFNHRFGLFDGVLIKENHIAACGSIQEAVDRCRHASHHLMKIEVEVRNMKELDEALEAGADVIMLDNMNPQQVKLAVERVAGRVPLEASGNVSLDNIREYADAGVNFISVGSMTYAARAVDISMYID